MSKTFGKLFGPGGQQTTSSTPTGFDSLSPEAQKLYNTSLTNAQGLTAQNFAPAANNSQQLQAAQYFGQPTESITPEQFQSGLSIFSNPFEEQVLQNNIRDINEQGRGGFSDIASMASDVGGFGSDRRGLLEAELQKNILKQVADTSATSRATNFENASNKTLAEIGNVRNLDMSKMGSLFDIGSQFQNTETATQNAPAQLQSYLANLATLLKGGGATTMTPDTGILGRVTGALGPAGTTAAISAVASDIRLKENIEFVGVENGHKTYEFNYIAKPLERWRGVMAQEVLLIAPEAVFITNDGYYAVDYGKIGVEFVRVS